MLPKLRSYTLRLFCFVTISLLFTVPVFAQTPKQKIVKTSAAKNQQAPVKMLKTVDMATAYQIWFSWYQSQYQGKITATPTLTVRNVDEQEGKRIQAIWKQAQVKAERDFYQQLKKSGQTEQAKMNMLPKVDKETAYKIWFDWYQAQKQGIQKPVPSLKVRNASEKEVKRITTIWNNAQIKAEIDVQNQHAQLNQSNSQWVTTFYVKDAQGSTRALTDAGGNVTDTFDYDSYGNLINRTGNTPNTRLYAGEEFDQDLGFYYLRARFLDTVKGRFVTQDIFEGDLNTPLSLHKYLYANGNPVNNIDPSGNSTIASVVSGFSSSNILANISSLQLLPTLASLQDSSQLMTLKLNLVYEKKGSIFYNTSEKQEVFNTYVPPAKQAFGNIDIDFSITETDGDAENVFNINRTITAGYVPGSLNALFTKRGDPGTGRFLSSPEATNAISGSIFIGTKGNGRDPKNLAHGIIHALGIATKLNGFTDLNAENTTIDVERALFSGRQDYTDKNSIYYKLRLWSVRYLDKKQPADRPR